MTSVFMILEVSGNYSIILPVIICNTISYLISRGFQEVPLFDLLSRQDGLDLPSLEEEREQEILRVEDAMHPTMGRALLGGELIASARSIATSTPEEHFLVSLGEGRWSVLSRQALLDACKRRIGASADSGSHPCAAPLSGPVAGCGIALHQGPANAAGGASRQYRLADGGGERARIFWAPIAGRDWPNRKPQTLGRTDLVESSEPRSAERLLTECRVAESVPEELTC